MQSPSWTSCRLAGHAGLDVCSPALGSIPARGVRHARWPPDRVHDTRSQIYLVNWDGTNNHLLLSGEVGTFWYSGSSRYLFCYQGLDLVRVNLDDLSDKVSYYSGENQKDYLSISADGSQLGGERERLNHGILKLSDRSWTRYHNDECWSTITPDNTYRFLVFTGSHRAWKAFSAPYNVSHQLVLNGDSRFNGTEVYHPRFSVNDASIVSVTGPYPNGITPSPTITPASGWTPRVPHSRSKCPPTICWCSAPRVRAAATRAR
jgi:hypothetical protein